MNRSNKSKIAVTLLSALAFGANAQAQDFNKNKIVKTDSFSIIKDSKLGDKSVQTLGAVRGANSNKNLKRIEEGLSILEKVLIGLVITASAVEAANETVAGVRWGMGKESDSIIKGKYSIVNGVRLMLNGNKDNPNLDPNEKKITKIKNENKLDILLKKLNDVNKAWLQNLKDDWIAVHKKISASNECECFYSKFVRKNPEYKPVANAILNFIAGENKFDASNAKITQLTHAGVFNIFVQNGDNSLKCMAVFGAEKGTRWLKVVGSRQILLVVNY